MHDTHLTEKISSSVVKLCAEKKIFAINELRVSVHKESHLSEEILEAFIKEKEKTLVGKDTRILILRDQEDIHSAVIQYIDGYTKSET